MASTRILLALLFPLIFVGATDDNRGFLVNKIVDKVLEKVKTSLKSDGFDPLYLPPYDIKLLGLGFVGKLELNDCQLYNLSTLYRSETVKYQQVNKTLDIVTGIGFGNLKINCTYKASLLNLGLKNGRAVINIPALQAGINLAYFIKTGKVSLKDLSLVNEGPIDVHLEGGILDTLMTLIIEAITYLLKNVILNYIETTLEHRITQILEGNIINSTILHDLDSLVDQTPLLNSLY